MILEQTMILTKENIAFIAPPLYTIRILLRKTAYLYEYSFGDLIYLASQEIPLVEEDVNVATRPVAPAVLQ